ncbi:MAG: hypothetical protein RLY71_1373 [Pseudomonadota bacterium]|jgi:glycosyltransferase involved in cell wall biosynthesis
MKKISIIGTVGLPANYGGFETLVENLARHHSKTHSIIDCTVYCSSKSYATQSGKYLNFNLKYIPLKANGPSSIIYDILSIISAIKDKSDIILVLGVSGAIILPFVKKISNVKIITNIDGIEWRREKWKGLVKNFLKLSEISAVKYSDAVIADNEAISNYVRTSYGVSSHVIAYGGDHAQAVESVRDPKISIPSSYCFCVCRIEPENNIHIILSAFADSSEANMVIVGNWKSSEYGKNLLSKYSSHKNIFLLDPIYDTRILKSLRKEALYYIHGHSAGGTNPSLVEAMSIGCPVIAFDCEFNRCTTENKAEYFLNASDISKTIQNCSSSKRLKMISDMKEIAAQKYTWNSIAKKYFDLLESVVHSH